MVPREYAAGTTAGDVARSIGKRLAKAAVAASVDGAEFDLERDLPDGASVAIITDDTPDGRHVLRHSTAHVMAQAVTQLFPGAKYSIGPAIENGFYYDFELPGGRTFTRRRPGCDRRRDARDHRGRPAVHALRGVRRRGARPVRRPALQGRDHRAGQGGGRVGGRPRQRRGGGRRDDQRLPQHARVPRPVQGPARADDGAPRSLHAAARLGRLLAGQREGPDAAAHLRHGVGVRRRLGGAPATSSSRPRSATTAASPPTSTCSASRARSAAASPCGTPRGPSCAS